MKQKRKETPCLHSSKQNLNAIGTVTLLGVVCGVLGIISVGLLTKSAMAVGDGNTSSVVYTGVDDKIDVVVGLNFIDQNNQSKDLYNFYESGDNLYVTPNNVVVNVTNTNGEIVKNNEVIGSVYGHVLGGEGNKLNSDNVTIIAGSSNEIGAGNTNAVLLGGTGNTMGGSNVIALVGGEGNTIGTSKKSGIIVGGKGNKLTESTQSLQGSVSILGGQENLVGGDNVLVGGLKVMVGDNLENLFAYSSKNLASDKFNTKSSDAFYLDIQKGLGINLESNKGGVEMQGAMGFGEVDINQGCNDSSNNYGVQGTWNGCMVGCTKAGGGKWQLLDSSESCKTKCEDNSNGRCVVDVYNPSEVAGKCSDAKVSKMNTEMCGGRDPVLYKDIIFETTLIDSEWNCNGGNLKNNQCVYKCKQGYHLTGDTTNLKNDERKQIGKGCYQDCTLDGVTKKHNETLYGYQNKQVTCSNDANSPASPQTCINYDNRAELLCVDGRWYDKTHGKWKDDNKYNNKSCTLSSYTNRCTALGYKLTKSGITSTSKKYYDYNMNWNNIDRGESKGERGIYVLCKDWTASGIDTCKSTETNPVQYHYYLKGCKNGYTRFSSTTNHPDSNGDQCRKNCSFNGQIFTDGGTTPGFKLADVNCAGKCESATLTCKDGTWYVGNIANADRIYSKGDCNLHDGTKCQSKFNLTVKPNSTTTKFETCVDYTAVGKYKCNTNYKYHKTGCQPGYGGDNCDASVDGKCGSEKDKCEKGTFKDKTDSDTEYKWKCEGINGGKDSDTCTASKEESDAPVIGEAVDGKCGSEKDKCEKGTFKDKTDSSTEYKWKCEGINGGKDSGTCTAAIPVCTKKTDGKCSTKLNECEVGTPEDIDDTDDYFKWKCNGCLGGKSPTCKKERGKPQCVRDLMPDKKQPENTEINDKNLAPTNSDTPYFHGTKKVACAFSCINEGSDYEWNEKTKKCDKIVAKPVCKYGESGPACEAGSEVKEDKATDYGFEWKCANESSSVKCSMAYYCEEPIFKYVVAPIEVVSPGFPWASACKKNYPTEYQTSSLRWGNMDFISKAGCDGVVDGLGVIVNSNGQNNYAEVGSCCHYVTDGSQYPGCGPCFVCGTKTIGTNGDRCMIEGSESSLSNCKGLRDKCEEPLPELSCKEDKYELLNTYNYKCSVYSNLPKNLTLSEAINKMYEDYGWVHTQAFGPNDGGTTHDVRSKGSPCEAGSIYCAPCVSPKCMD